MSDLDQLFVTLRQRGGSDLHLSAGRPPILRISGEVEALDGEPPLNDDALKQLLSEIVSPEEWRSFERDGDFDFAYALPNVGRFRGNYFRQERGVGAVFRLVPETILGADELGLPDAIKKLAELESGLVLITGPTGSGKSTTLAAIIDLINRGTPRHVVTIEDPLEFVHQNKSCVISHREVGKHAESFADALAAALRQDADVVLVGEMRDPETISLAIEGASMGILVFGTLHTSSAAKTVDRVIDAFPADQQAQAQGSLADSLMAVVSQVLCKKAGGGRMGVHEILIRNRGLAGAIREGNTAMINSIIGAGRGLGMQTLDDALAQALEAGLIDGYEAYLKCNDKRRFQQFAG